MSSGNYGIEHVEKFIDGHALIDGTVFADGIKAGKAEAFYGQFKHLIVNLDESAMSKTAIPLLDGQSDPNVFKDGLYIRGDRIVIVSGNKEVVKIGKLN